MGIVRRPTLKFRFVGPLTRAGTLEPNLSLKKLCANICSRWTSKLSNAWPSTARAPEITCWNIDRSEEHTSELQSRGHLVCRLLLEKKKTRNESCPSIQ